MCQVLLDPLEPAGDRKIQRAVYDRSTDTTLSVPIAEAPADAVLLFDGVFLLRPELADRWDLSIFMSVTFERTLDRAQTRGEALAGSAASRSDVDR
jgi:uridine kinase